MQQFETTEHVSHMKTAMLVAEARECVVVG